MDREDKVRLIMALGAIALIITIGVIWFVTTRNEEKANPDATGTAAEETSGEINLAEFKPADGELLSVRLPNSEELVYIEGADEATIANIDIIFRHYEENADTTEATTEETANEGSLEWLGQQFTEVEIKLAECFDPGFDLRTAYNEKTASIGETHRFHELVSALSKQPEEAFYFRKDEELGGYRMSVGYCFMAMVYTDLPTEMDSLESIATEFAEK